MKQLVLRYKNSSDVRTLKLFLNTLGDNVDELESAQPQRGDADFEPVEASRSVDFYPELKRAHFRLFVACWSISYSLINDLAAEIEWQSLEQSKESLQPRLDAVDSLQPDPLPESYQKTSQYLHDLLHAVNFHVLAVMMWTMVQIFVGESAPAVHETLRGGSRTTITIGGSCLCGMCLPELHLPAVTWAFPTFGFSSRQGVVVRKNAAQNFFVSVKRFLAETPPRLFGREDRPFRFRHRFAKQRHLRFLSFPDIRERHLRVLQNYFSAKISADSTITLSSEMLTVEERGEVLSRLLYVWEHENNRRQQKIIGGVCRVVAEVEW